MSVGNTGCLHGAWPNQLVNNRTRLLSMKVLKTSKVSTFPFHFPMLLTVCWLCFQNLHFSTMEYRGYYWIKKNLFFMLIGPCVVHTHIQNKLDSRSNCLKTVKQRNTPNFLFSKAQISTTVRFLPSAWFWNKEQFVWFFNETIRKTTLHYKGHFFLRKKPIFVWRLCNRYTELHNYTMRIYS